jgi:hypothetical protein
MTIIFPNISTNRICMRELTLDDVEAVFGHFSYPEVTKFMDIDVCKNRSEAEEIIAFQINDSGCRYGLFHASGHSALGPAGVRSGFEEAIAVAGKHNQPDTSAPTKRIVPGSFGALSRWDVVNTTTLSERCESSN